MIGVNALMIGSCGLVGYYAVQARHAGPVTRYLILCCTSVLITVNALVLAPKAPAAARVLAATGSAVVLALCLAQHLCTPDPGQGVRKRGAPARTATPKPPSMPG